MSKRVDVIQVLSQNTDNVKKVLKTILAQMPDARDCPCVESLKFARME